MDPYGWTALMSAVWNNHGSVAELLIDTEGPLILENAKVMRMVSVARKMTALPSQPVNKITFTLSLLCIQLLTPMPRSNNASQQTPRLVLF